MVYIVLDLEWNQPVSKNSYPYLSIGDKMSNEIIQIGAYKVSDKLQIIDSFCTYVKPKYYKKLNSVVKRITNIDKQQVCAGKDFVEAIELFRQWCTDEFCLFTWGSDDVYVMKQNLEFYGIDTSFIKRWYDMQTIFSKAYLQEKTQKSLQFAMEFLGIEESEERQLHDALDDAYYTAQIFVKHDIEECLLRYTRTSSFADLCSELDDTRFGGFYSKKKAMSDKSVSQVHCPECGEKMKKYDSWLSLNGKYVCVAACPEHGDFVSRVKLNKHLDGKFYVNKITKKANAQTCDTIREKCAASREKAAVKKARAAKAI